MAAVSPAGSRRMYSWWWDSHISPKNSKWLQENLTDMDSKVKQMIKVIEEDADSFARRAEMYYKKRPELMKLVEEFYRAYRALAERYDHATGVIRQAHRTMAEAFPNQVPFMLSDESPGSVAEAEPHTPEMAHPGRAKFDPDELEKDDLGLSSSQLHAVKRNGAFSDESDSLPSRKGMKQFNDSFGSREKFTDGRARKGLNFHAVEEERDQSVQHNGSQNLEAQALLNSDRMGKAETEILNLKNALAKLESEKDAGLLKYEQSLERLSNLESEVSRAQNVSKDLNERASKAEAEVQFLKEALAKLQREREASLLQYQHYLEKISNLENSVNSAQKNAGELNERAQKAETVVEALKQDLSRIGAERDAALEQYKQSLEMISNQQGKLVHAEKDARQINERADKAEREVETLKQAFSKLVEEKEAAVVQYLQCLETISNLESKLARAQEEAERLNAEINDGVAKLKGAEERCLALENSNQTLQLELESLVHKVGSQGKELTEKQKELGRLWTCIQEERLRFVEAETAFQTLQHLHSQSQEELRSLVAELQNGADILNDMKTRNRGLEDEVQKINEENKGLNEINLSSAMSVKNLQDDIMSLRKTMNRLEEEVELRVDQRNALQQDIFCLKEELNGLTKKHQTMLEQVESVGYDPQSFGSSVKELQDQNTKLKQICETNQVEKVTLLEQLKFMEKLIEKNALLENSVADLNDELEGTREKVKALEESYWSLLEEKSFLATEKTCLVSQLQVTNENLEKLLEKNGTLENSLFDANNELEGLRVKSESLEDLCLLLDGEKSGLITERDSLVSHLNLTRQRLEDFGKRYAALEEKLSVLEKDGENALGMVEELCTQLDAEKKQHDNFCQLSDAQLASRELQIFHLQEEGLRRKREYEEEQDKSLKAGIEILVFQKCIQGLEENHLALLTEQQKLAEKSVKSTKLISEMNHENIGQKVENKSLSEHNSILRMGLYQLMQILDTEEEHNGCDHKAEGDRSLLEHVIVKLQKTQDTLVTSFDENQRLVTENSILVAILEQLQWDGFNLMTERNSIDLEYRIQSEQLLASHVMKQEVLTTKIEDLQRQLVNLRSAYEDVEQDNIEAINAKRSLTLTVSDLEEQRSCLEEENRAMFGETVFHSNLSLVFEDAISKNLGELAELTEKLSKVYLNNVDLNEKAGVLEEKLEGLRMENVHLKQVLAKSESELHIEKSVNDRLQEEIVDAKQLLLHKENDIQRWESQADAFFAELQIANVCEALLAGKINEIVGACASLEDESNPKGVEIELLKQKLGTLGDANGVLQTQLATYASAIISLKSRIASLEKHTMYKERSKLEEPEVTHLIAQHAELSKTDEVQTTVLPDGISELQDLQRRIKAIEISVTEKEKVVMPENLAAGAKPVPAMAEIEELKARGSSRRENGQTSKHVAANEGQEESRDGLNKNLRVRTRRTKTREISELDNEVLTKYIVLDQISSECSSFRRSRREMVEGDNHLLELWETADHGGSIGLTAAEATRTHKSKNPSAESLIEKELGVDKLEISRRVSEPRRERNKRRVHERLDSDAQKLSNLQITVQDLKIKIEITEKTDKGKGVEHDAVKRQLEEAEQAIAKLFDANRKLTENFEDSSQPSESTSVAVLDKSGSVRRRRVSEQARLGSEQIGRLQLEVQRLQFLLLKLDGDRKENTARTRVPDHNSRVLLRDYLYGGTVRARRKHKKATFCSCVQPPTGGD